jgi:8-oxo-dGTP pyrophosphatase MutT (NUDIX family)
MTMNTRILARVVTYDLKENKILLVKNKDTNFWYAPGGGWEQDRENILECAKREVKEETGIEVGIARLLYIQEFHATVDTIFFETFWLARPIGDTSINELHIDLDPNGAVEKAQWFSQPELQDIKVFPKRLKNTFWENINALVGSEDPFIGVS